MGGVGGVGGVPDDAGAPDADVVPDAAPADSGINGDCPANLETTLSDAIVEGTSPIAIARIIFRTTPEPGVTVVFKNVSTTPFSFGDTPLLYSGALDASIDLSDLDPLAPGEEVTRFISDTDVDGGEIALLSLNGTFAAVYVAWGDDYVSQEVTGDFDDNPLTEDTATTDTLEEIAIVSGGGGVWTDQERVSITAPQNTIFGVAGDQTDSSDGFDVCTGDGDVSGQ